MQKIKSLGKVIKFHWYYIHFFLSSRGVFELRIENKFTKFSGVIPFVAGSRKSTATFGMTGMVDTSGISRKSLIGMEFRLSVS